MDTIIRLKGKKEFQRQEEVIANSFISNERIIMSQDKKRQKDNKSLSVNISQP